MFKDRTFWVYPWDIADGKLRDRLTGICQLGASAISIPFSYHSLRALAPRHSERRVFNVTSALCFRPRGEEFLSSSIQPVYSEWATDEGPITGLFENAENMSLRIRAWTVVFHSTRLATMHADSAITNCFGEVFAHALCPSAPKSRDYALRLARAISARPIHAIELEAVGFYGYEHLSHHEKCGVAFDLLHHFLFSCCFCDHCRIALLSSGIDPDFICERFRARLSRYFDGEISTVNCPERAEAELRYLIGEDAATGLLRMRAQCILGLLQEIRNIVPRSIELTVTAGLSPFECSAQFGAHPKDILKIADRLLLVVFEPHDSAFRKRFQGALKCFPDSSRWIAGMRIFPPDANSRETIEARLRFLENQGFCAVHLYHYGLAPTHLLNAAARTWASSKGGND